MVSPRLTKCNGRLAKFHVYLQDWVKMIPQVSESDKPETLVIRKLLIITHLLNSADWQAIVRFKLVKL